MAAEEKRRLRREMMARRRRVSAAVAEAAARAVAAALLSDSRIAAARAIGLYAALPAELPSRAVFDGMAARSSVILFPRCIGEKLLGFFRIRRWEELVPGRYGVLEPARGLDPETLGPDDVVVVPAVALSASGQRLGRGAGYYDRTFGGAPTPRLVGAAYEFQVLDEVPCEEHDRRMHAIVTERGLRWLEDGGT